jgi:hypothetical protein
MVRKSKEMTGTVSFVGETNKPNTAEPAVVSDPPSVDIPDSTVPSSAPAPPKAKRPYTKKHEQYWKAMTGSRKALLMPIEAKNEIIVPDAPTKRRPGRPKNPVAPVPVAPAPAPVPVVVKKEKAKAKPVTVKAPLKAKAKPVKKVYTAPSESEEDDDDDDDETDEEEEEPVIEVVAQKANRRLKTLDKIDKRIKELSNSYSARGYSVF